MRRGGAKHREKVEGGDGGTLRHVSGGNTTQHNANAKQATLPALVVVCSRFTAVASCAADVVASARAVGLGTCHSRSFGYMDHTLQAKRHLMPARYGPRNQSDTRK